MKPSVVRTQRRAVLGSALAAVAISPWPASAKSSGTAKYASGYVAPKSPAEVKAEVLALHVQPYVAAYASKDWTALAGLYLPEATIIDGSRKGEKLATVSGAELSSYLSQQPYLTELQLTVTKVNAEVEYDGGELKTIHAQFDFSHVAGRFRVYRRLVQTPGGWKVDRELRPLDSPKAYNLLQPKRDIFGNVYMEMSV